MAALVLATAIGGCGGTAERAPSTSGHAASTSPSPAARQSANGSGDSISSLDVLRGKTPPSAANKHCGPLTGITEARYAARLEKLKRAFGRGAATTDAARRDMAHQLQAVARMKGILAASCSDNNTDSVIVTRFSSTSFARDRAEQPFTTSPISIDDTPEHPWTPLASGSLGGTARCATKPATITLGDVALSVLYEACSFALRSYVVMVQETDRGDVSTSRTSPGTVEQTVAVKAWLEAVAG